MSKMTRRRFLKGSLAMTGSACCAAASGILGSNVVWAQTTGGNGKTIVVLHLDGGNDWHHSFDVARTTSARSAYEQARPNTNVAANLILPTADGYGFHPALGRLHTEFQGGNVRVMRRLGTLNPSRSHGTEQLKFENGDFKNVGLGWMGRVMDTVASQGGSISRFMTMSIRQGNPIDIQGAEHRGLGLRDLNSYNLTRQTSTRDQDYREYIAKNILQQTQTTAQMTASVKEGQENMYESIDILANAASSFTGRALSAVETDDAYPTGRPGPALRQIAMLIQAGLGTQLALCGFGGFDTHSNAGAETGNHATLMSRLDQAVGAFLADMRDFGKQNDVAIAIDSEFGRTLRENGSGGTDHGQAMAMLMVGDTINGGVSGTPVTGDEFLRNGGRKNWIHVETHFANAYEEALAWAGLPANGIFSPHPDHNFNLFS